MKIFRALPRTAYLALVITLTIFACKPASDRVASLPPPPDGTATNTTPDTPGGLTPATAKDTGDAYVENLSAEPAMLSPILSLTDGGGQYLGGNIFDPLLKINNETLEFEPYLAEKWDISEDHLSYTFHLRKDIKYSDGKPMTAHDFKFTLDLINDKKTDSAPARSYLSDIESCEVVDDYTFKFIAKKPYFRHLLTFAGFQPLPRHIYGNGDINKHPGNRAPIGSGPYKFETWDTNSQIVLVRNPLFWGEKPALDKRIFKFITDDDASFQVLERHEIDSMQMQPQMWVTRASAAKFEAEFAKLKPASPIPGYLSRFGYIAWNMRKPQFSDNRVRRAMTMLLNRQQILDTIFKGLGELISSDASPSEPEYNQNVKPLAFDPAAAIKLLEEAGWVDSDRDGVREKDGVKLEFEFTFAVDVVEYLQLATVFQEELTRAGIKMTPRPLEWATFQERVQKRTFDACMLAWLTTPLYDPYQLWHSSQTEQGSNYPGFANAEADEIMENARVEFDRNKRIEMYHRFHEILDEAQPYTFLWARYGLIALDKRFQNVKVYPIGFDPLEWWVPTAQQRYP